LFANELGGGELDVWGHMQEQRRPWPPGMKKKGTPPRRNPACYWEKPGRARDPQGGPFDFKIKKGGPNTRGLL